MSANDLKSQGNALFQSGDFAQALKLFSEAITLSPNDHVLYSNRSACHAKLEDYNSALIDAEKCVSLKSDWARGYQRLGLAQFYLKQYKEAVATYQKGIEIDPNNVSLKEGLEQAEQALEEGGGGYIQQMLLKLMGDPETKEYLQDPNFVQKMQMIQQNPQMIGMFASDPKVQKALQVMFGLPQGKSSSYLFIYPSFSFSTLPPFSFLLFLLLLLLPLSPLLFSSSPFPPLPFSSLFFPPPLLPLYRSSFLPYILFFFNINKTC